MYMSPIEVVCPFVFYLFGSVYLLFRIGAPAESIGAPIWIVGVLFFAVPVVKDFVTYDSANETDATDVLLCGLLPGLNELRFRALVWY